MTRRRLEDVARAPGVSLATADRALNGRPGVREQTRRRIEDAARRLGYRPDRAAAALADQSGVFLTIEDFDRLVRSGRLSRGRAWLGQALNMKPVLGVSREGKLEPVARARGSAAARRKILELIDRALARKPREVRLAVVHADIPDFAAELRAELVARYAPKTCLVAPITPVIPPTPASAPGGCSTRSRTEIKPVTPAL